MFRKRVEFDAFLIVSEICAILSTFYLSYMSFVFFADFFLKIPFSTQQITNYMIFHFTTKTGLISIFGELFGGIISSLLFVFLEGKARKSLDFVSTTFALHLIIISCLCSFPQSFCWWFSTILSLIISVILAGRLSFGIEMQDINIEAIFPSSYNGQSSKVKNKNNNI